jgi:hypothetical protein
MPRADFADFADFALAYFALAYAYALVPLARVSSRRAPRDRPLLLEPRDPVAGATVCVLAGSLRALA